MKLEITDDEHSLILEVLEYSLSDNINCLSDCGVDPTEADDEINMHIKELEELIKKIEGKK